MPVRISNCDVWPYGGQTDVKRELRKFRSQAFTTAGDGLSGTYVISLIQIEGFKSNAYSVSTLKLLISWRSVIVDSASRCILIRVISSSKAGAPTRPLSPVVCVSSISGSHAQYKQGNRPPDQRNDCEYGDD